MSKLIAAGVFGGLLRGALTTMYSDKTDSEDSKIYIETSAANLKNRTLHKKGLFLV